MKTKFSLASLIYHSKNLSLLLWWELQFKLFGRRYSSSISITKRCNLRCRYCYKRQELSSEDDVSISEWERRFKEYHRMGIRNVTLLGGEPALRYDILELAERYFPFIALCSNGQVKIPEAFNHRIYLSIDGTREENDAIRGEGTFDNAIRNYRGDKRAIVLSTISKENYRHLNKFIDEIRGLKVQGIMFNFYCPLRKENNRLVLNKKQRLEAKGILLRELNRKDSILFMTKDMIDYLVERGPAKRCALKEKALSFTADNRLQYCDCSSVGCSRCSAIFSCISPPVWNLPAWFRHKKSVYARILKLS